MPLVKNKIPIPLSLGLDTKTDEKQQPIGTFHILENAVFDEPGKLKKRKGYDKVDLIDTDGNAISNNKKIQKFKDELVMFNDADLHSYSSTINQWSNKGNAFTVIPESTQILRNSVEQSMLDSEHAEGLNIYVYADSNGVHLSIMDESTKAFLISNQTLSATGSHPKVINRGNTIYITYLDSLSLKFRRFSIFDFNNITAESTITSTQDTIYDTQLVNDKIMIGYNSTTAGGTLTLQSINADDTISTATEIAGETASVAIGLCTDMTNRIICSYYDSTDVKVLAFNYTLGVKVLAETSIETISDVKNVSIIEHATDSYTIVYEVGATESYNHYIKQNTINTSASIGTPSIVAKSVALASKLWIHNSLIYITTLHNNTLQSTLFIMDLNGNISTKIAQNTAGELVSIGSLPRVSQVSSEKYLISSQVKGRLSQDNGVFFSILGVNSNVLDFSSGLEYDSTTLGQNLHISGGYMKMYDGSQIVEHNFHLFPEGLADGGNSTLGGVLNDGTYGYVAVYAWTDAQGILHRSAPSLSTSIVLTGGTATQQQTITVPTLRLTDKENVTIELYRTEDSGTIYYLISDNAAPTLNDKTVDSVSIVDATISDTDLISRETLYNTGDVLDNLPAPSSSIIESFKNRIFVTTNESSKLNYSKIQFEGFAVNFNDSLEILIPSNGGNNKALKAMDDKLIIFKENSIYFLSGDGPNNLGEQDTFIEPELVSSEIGCNNSFSVVLTPLGIFFSSNKGIYLLSRSLGLQYIGAPVEDFNNLTITSSVMVADKNQIRFTTSDGDCLVFNYHQNKWATFSNHKALSAVSVDNVYYYLRPDNLLYKENSSFEDNGTSIKLKLESGWLSFAGVQNFQRVYKMLLLGSFKSDHKIRIKVAYDYVEAWTQEQTIDVSDFIDNSAYGSSTTYGSDATYATQNLYQIRLDFARQKCQSIKISIEDIQSSTGESLELSNALFVVGTKATEAKVNSANKYGTN